MRKVERRKNAFSLRDVLVLALAAAVAGSGLVVASAASADPVVCQKKKKFKIRPAECKNKETQVADLGDIAALRDEVENPTVVTFAADSGNPVTTPTPFRVCASTQVLWVPFPELDGEIQACQIFQNADGTWDISASGNVACEAHCY